MCFSPWIISKSGKGQEEAKDEMLRASIGPSGPSNSFYMDLISSNEKKKEPRSLVSPLKQRHKKKKDGISGTE